MEAQRKERGLTLEQIQNELLSGFDLSKKGNRKRQTDYAIRTAQKAFARIPSSNTDHFFHYSAAFFEHCTRLS